MYESHRIQREDSKNEPGDAGLSDTPNFLDDANNHAVMPDDVHSGQTPIPLRHGMGPYSHDEAFHGPMQPFTPTDFHEPHGMQQPYPAWPTMEMGNTPPSSLNLYPETLDPTLYPNDMYQSSTHSLHQQLPFPHGDPGALPFDQNYDSSWDHLPHPAALPWQNTSNGGTPNSGASAEPHGAGPHLRGLSPNQQPPTSGPMHPRHLQSSSNLGSILLERGLFGRMDNKQTAGRIADKSRVRSILGNMQRMDSRYRSYAREHLLDMDSGKTLATDRAGRPHRTTKKLNRVRNTSKKRKRREMRA